MTIENDREIQQLKKRIRELEEKSFVQNIYTYTGFLSMSEQAVFMSMEKELNKGEATLYGGHSICERRMLRFGSPQSLGYEENYPISCLCIKPLMEKFADSLTHRDFLGAAMNLGIERNLIGDIFIQGKSAVMFCAEKIAPYIMDNLKQVKHTHVKCIFGKGQSDLQIREPEQISFTISSARIDGVVAKIFNLSRTQSLTLFQAGKIFVNGRLTENNSYTLKVNDGVTVRGFGKFIYYGIGHETKKGKLSVTAGMYR